MGLKIKTDTLTPGMRRIATAMQPAGRVELLEAMATKLEDMVQDAFSDPRERIAPWPAKKDGSQSNLVKSTLLKNSITVQEVTASEAKVGTPVPYGAAHQFGVRGRNLPARPFFPFQRGRMTPQAQDSLRRIAEKKLEKLLRV